MRNLINIVENPAKQSEYFHVTVSENVPSIMSTGLIPKIGDRSINYGETRPAIYLFRSKADAEDAVWNWFGDEFDGEEELSLLKVSLPEGIPTEDEAFETRIYDTVPPQFIEDLGEM